MTWTAAAVRAAVGLPPSTGEGPAFTAISTDTRTLGPGACFLALAGERFDGHDHLAAAAAAGARGAVVREGTPPVPGLELFPVPDTLRALGDLGRARRRQVSGPVVAITGTNGKTSTKEMVAAVLGTRFRVHKTAVNLNNLVGIPQTILAAPEGTDALVVEAGANQRGEIARAREIIEPTHAIITNVGAGHLEGFGGLEDVLREKLELVRGAPVAVVGLEPPALAAEAGRIARRVVTAGLGPADVTPDDVDLDRRAQARVRIDGVAFTVPLPGRHLAANAMLAWALVRELGLEPARAAEALAGVEVPGGRSEMAEHGGLTVLNDCYNANPESFRAAIATAAALRGNRPLVFLAGTMRELGPESARLHAEVAGDLVALAPDLLGGVGEFAPALERHRAALGDRLLTADDPEALGPAVARRLRGDELVVLKASRGVALERILPYLIGRAIPSS